MSNIIKNKLSKIGIALPEPTPAAGTYVPYIITGNLIYISGQVPVDTDGLQFQGKLGDAYSVEEGQAAARLCAINILAQLSAALEGDLDRVTQCVKLGGFINCTPDFTDHPAVMNGASDLMVDVFSDIGRHARFAVGAPSLPFDVAVEVDAIFKIK